MSLLGFLFVYLIFWGIKGVYVNVKPANYILMTITVLAWFGLFSIANGFSSRTGFVVKGYLIFNLVDYFMNIFSGRSFDFDLFYSKVQIYADEAIINYSFFRVFFIIAINIASFIKTGKVVGSFKRIVVDIDSNEGHKIKINI